MQEDWFNHWIHQGILAELEVLLGCIQLRGQIPVHFRLKTGIDPLGETPITPNAIIDSVAE